MRIEGKVVLITGGTSGIGASICAQLLENNAKVAIWGRDSSKIEELLANNPNNAKFFQCELSDVSSQQQVFNDTVQAFGRVDILINSAGVGSLGLTPDYEDIQVFEQLLNINLISAFNLARLFAFQVTQQQQTDEQTQGVIIFFSSVLAENGTKRQVLYSASKSAINGITLPMARDLGRLKIRVATIAPGSTDTPMIALFKSKEASLVKHIPVGRFAQPEEVASLTRAVIENDYITGKIYYIDGGYIPNL